jgi:hypothetical protein
MTDVNGRDAIVNVRDGPRVTVRVACATSVIRDDFRVPLPDVCCAQILITALAP